MPKRIEHSEDTKTWKTFAACEDADFERAWAALQKWIEEQQPYGFFRAVDDPRPLNEIIPNPETISPKVPE